jgi:hypothetical protein
VKDVPSFVKSNVTRDAVSQKDMVVVAQLQWEVHPHREHQASERCDDFRRHLVVFRGMAYWALAFAPCGGGGQAWRQGASIN